MTTSSSIASSVTSAITSSIAASVTSSLSHPPTIAPSSTSAAPAAQSTASNSNNNGPQSSPLLFFVALGFGVVFTNLWIIVGVKYCFRYSARNRRPHDENGDPIDLGTMPRQRRRREKKLMTMEEVNDRFPIMKYKAWTVARAEQGLSTAGGVDPTASRPASIKNEAGTIGEARGSSDDAARPGTATSARREVSEATTEAQDSTADQEQHDGALQEVKTTASTQPERTEDEEEEAIQMAVPTEMMTSPGDSCAICIDTLEEDDDVRGLTCGHAFHASCVDPWLTSRRACCPLCKADYYVPKPRPEGENLDLERGMSRRSTGIPQNVPLSPAAALLGSRFMRAQQARQHSHNAHVQPTHAAPRFPLWSRRNRPPPRPQNLHDPTQPSAGQITPHAVTPRQSGNWATRLRAPIPAVHLPRAPWRRGNAEDSTAEANPSPSRLEAGR